MKKLTHPDAAFKGYPAPGNFFSRKPILHVLCLVKIHYFSFWVFKSNGRLGAKVNNLKQFLLR